MKRGRLGVCVSETGLLKRINKRSLNCVYTAQRESVRIRIALTAESFVL